MSLHPQPPGISLSPIPGGCRSRDTKQSVGGPSNMSLGAGSKNVEETGGLPMMSQKRMATYWIALRQGRNC